MKLQVLQEELSKALTTVSRFVSNRAQLPVLANVLLKTNKNKLMISSTNLEISVSTLVGSQTNKEGEITVSAKTITDLVNNLSMGPIKLESEKEQLKIKASGFSSRLSGMNAGDFPTIPTSVGKNFLKLPTKDLTKTLSKVLFAVSTDETRPVLTGVLFIFTKGNLSLIATDGFRLSVSKIKLSGGEKGDRLILPRNALSEVIRLTGGEDELKLSVQKKDSQAVFGMGNTVLSTRVLAGEFPDYKKIIPKESEIVVRADKEDMIQAVKLASVFARESSNIVKLKLTKKELEISADSANAGSQKKSVEVRVEKGGGKKDFEIAFNYRFLEELLNSIEADEVVLSLTTPNAPCVFTDPGDKNFLHLIMPVKIQG